MKNFQYKNYCYDLAHLVIYNKDSNLPDFKDGKVLNLETNEQYDINKLCQINQDLIRDMINKSNSFISYDQRKRIKKIFDNEAKKLFTLDIEQKLNDNTLTLDDLKIWKEVVSKKERQEFGKIKFKHYTMLNLQKGKHSKLNYADYGRFIHLLEIVHYRNKITYNNGQPIKRKELMKLLEFKNIKSLDSYLSKLKKLNIIKKTQPDKDNISFFIINPIYATKHITIDSITFYYFKDEIKEHLSPLEYRYYELLYHYKMIEM